MADLSYAEVSRLLKADFEAAKLFYLPRPVEMFALVKSWKTWNTRFAGKQAFTTPKDGYWVGNINGKMYRAHRVLWLLHTGEWPKNQIDHINGDRGDNRLVNLRDVTSAENHKNKCMLKNNKSGVLGVTWDKSRNKWMAHMRIDGHHKTLGLFEQFEHAVTRRKLAEVEQGYHPNHGRPAPAP